MRAEHQPGPHRPGVRQGQAAVVVLALLAALTACSGSAGGTGSSTDGTGSSTDVSTAAPGPAGASAPAVTSTAPAPSAVPEVTPTLAVPAGLTRADVQAGLLSATFARSGSGKLVTVAGDAPAPGNRGRLMRVKVQVEKGLPVDGPRFATFVLKTLNDPRSWGHGGTRRFARVDSGAYDIRVVLASPNTSASMCAPLRTFGKLSCHSGDAAILTIYRWVKAIPDYGSDRTSYRNYLVNHEVGHALGHGHEYCPGKGKLAPVMQQQTKSLQGCRVNPWPYP